MLSRLLFLVLFSFCGQIFADVSQTGGIPFKAENTTVNEAASNLPYIFFVLIMLAVVVYIFGKKTGVFSTLSIDKAQQNSVKILHVKRITSNTTYFKLKIDDSEYMFLESKNSLQEIKRKSI